MIIDYWHILTMMIQTTMMILSFDMIIDIF